MFLPGTVLWKLFNISFTKKEKQTKKKLLLIVLDSMCIFTLIPLDLATNENTVFLKQLYVQEIFFLFWQKQKSSKKND